MLEEQHKLPISRVLALGEKLNRLNKAEKELKAKKERCAAAEMYAKGEISSRFNRSYRGMCR